MVRRGTVIEANEIIGVVNEIKEQFGEKQELLYQEIICSTLKRMEERGIDVWEENNSKGSLTKSSSLELAEYAITKIFNNSEVISRAINRFGFVKFIVEKEGEAQ